jgi:hypothetical protein
MRSRLLQLCCAATCGAWLAGCGENLSHPTRDNYVGASVQPLTCVPNLDGQIDASELQAAVGIPVSYVVSPVGQARAYDLAGHVDASGHQVWDLGTDYADDQLARIQAQDVKGSWFADSFPDGQFAAPADAAGRILAVYKHTDEALFALGLASAEEHPAEGKTLLVYKDPVALYRFPIAVGKSWSSTGRVQNGLIQDLPYAGVDRYDVSVDASGELVLPDLTFSQVLRVRTTLTTTPAVGAVQVRRQVSFFFECFGEVARATSALNEPNADFTNAAELRRLSLESPQ